jgi:hypothetical protein
MLPGLFVSREVPMSSIVDRPVTGRAEEHADQSVSLPDRAGRRSPRTEDLPDRPTLRSTTRAATITRLALANPQRRFGLTVGGLFLVFGVLSRAIGSGRLAPYLVPLGTVLFALGVLFPPVLAPVERLWMKLAAVLHVLSSTIVLTAIFFLVIAPIAIVRRALGHDSLRLRRTHCETHWIRCGQALEAASMKRQF